MVSADELPRGATLSAGTQRWLRAATITVAFAPERLGDGPGQYFPGRTLFAIPASRAQGRTPYSAVVRTASGTQCSLLFQIKKAGDVGFLTAICE